MAEPIPTRSDTAHAFYMRLALSEAHKSPPKPTNFCVGACLVKPLDPSKPAKDDHQSLMNDVVITGYTLECEGNTHAEQSCFIKLAAQYHCEEEELDPRVPDKMILYTTMEPCNKRSAGNLTCVERILRLRKKLKVELAIATVYVGVTEPEKFVGVNEGRARLQAAGIETVHVPGFEEEILAVATTGHER